MNLEWGWIPFRDSHMILIHVPQTLALTTMSMMSMMTQTASSRKARIPAREIRSLVGVAVEEAAVAVEGRELAREHHLKRVILRLPLRARETCGKFSMHRAERGDMNLAVGFVRIRGVFREGGRILTTPPV